MEEVPVSPERKMNAHAGVCFPNLASRRQGERAVASLFYLHHTVQVVQGQKKRKNAFCEPV